MTTSDPPKPAKDDPPRALIPTFSQPPPGLENPASPTPDHPATPTRATSRQALLEGDGRGSYAAVNPGSPSPNDQPPRTGTSTPGKTEPTLAEITKLAIGLLAVGTAVAAGLIRWRLRRKLREPTKTQATDIAAPLARIAQRRLNMTRLAPDIGDALEFAAAAGVYIGDGPLLRPLTPDPGMPTDIQETSE